MHRRLVPTLATVIAIVVFVAAGNWQKSRMHAKEALRAQYDAAIALPPIALSTVPASDTDPSPRPASTSLSSRC